MPTNWFNPKIILYVVMLVVFQHAIADEDAIYFDDDSLEFDESSMTARRPHALYPLKTSLSHSQTHIRPGEIENKRSRVSLLYERVIGDSFFVSLDWRADYFFQQDVLGRLADTDNGRTEWQQAWLQTSGENCNVKAGRMKIIWGEVEGTFAVDVVSPFDFTEQLFTDFSDVRLAQDSVQIECFDRRQELQLFVIHEARVNRNAVGLTLADQPHEEWGIRWKRYFNRFDVSLVAARLFANDAVPISLFEPNLGGVAREELVGFSASINQGQWLWKADVSARRQSAIGLFVPSAKRGDIALGFEFVSLKNHRFNGGLWYIDISDPFNTDLLIATMGWDKTYFNDDVTLSVLANYIEESGAHSLTMLGNYRIDDYWDVSLAIASNVAGDTEIFVTTPARDETEWTFQLNWTF